MSVFDVSAFALEPERKRAILLDELVSLTDRHRANCAPYASFLESHPGPWKSLEDLPYLPVSVFKHFDLVSVPPDDVAQVIRSSATTSGVSSKVYVDRETAALQRVTVNKIFTDHVGDAKRPYIVFDDRRSASGRGLSARGAALMSLMPLASKFFFVMKETEGGLELDRAELEKAVAAAREAGCFVAYGFTYILYLAHQEIAEAGLSLQGDWDPEKTFLLHSGGWKKLQDKAVDKERFNREIASIWGLAPQAVLDFYGMAELVGVVFVDCPEGNKHVPSFADIVIRDPATLESQPPGTPGLIQLVSALGRGGPSHSVITEDLGVLMHEDGCPCGRRGRAFRLLGRVAQAEVRGCGDVYASKRDAK